MRKKTYKRLVADKIWNEKCSMNGNKPLKRLANSAKRRNVKITLAKINTQFEG